MSVCLNRKKKRKIFLPQFLPLFSLCGVTAGCRPAALLSTMCALLPTLISHAKLRASQPQTAAAREPQATSHDISASLQLQMTPTLEPLAPQHTHIHTHRIYRMCYSPPITQIWPERSFSQYIQAQKHTDSHSYTQGSSPFNTKAQQLSCIFMGPTPENINRGCGAADLSISLFGK